MVFLIRYFCLFSSFLYVCCFVCFFAPAFSADKQKEDGSSSSAFSFDIDGEEMELDFDLDFDNSLLGDDDFNIAKAGNDHGIGDVDDKVGCDDDPIIIKQDSDVLVSQLDSSGVSMGGELSSSSATSSSSSPASSSSSSSSSSSGLSVTKHVLLRALDKVSGKTQQLKVVVGEVYRFNNLDILVRDVRDSDALSAPERTVFLEVVENDVRTGSRRRIFSGWMFMSSPSSSAMEHPVYDIWVAG